MLRGYGCEAACRRAERSVAAIHELDRALLTTDLHRCEQAQSRVVVLVLSGIKVYFTELDLLIKHLPYFV